MPQAGYSWDPAPSTPRRVRWGIRGHLEDTDLAPSLPPAAVFRRQTWWESAPPSPLPFPAPGTHLQQARPAGPLQHWGHHRSIVGTPPLSHGWPSGGSGHEGTLDGRRPHCAPGVGSPASPSGVKHNTQVRWGPHCTLQRAHGKLCVFSSVEFSTRSQAGQCGGPDLRLN